MLTTICTAVVSRPKASTFAASLLLVAAGGTLFQACAQVRMVTNRPALEAVMTACKVDREKFCSGVSVGGGRVAACLNKNLDALSPECRRALDDARGAVRARARTATR